MENLQQNQEESLFIQHVKQIAEAEREAERRVAEFYANFLPGYFAKPHDSTKPMTVQERFGLK